MSTESKTLWGSLAHSGAKLQQGDGSKRLLCRGFARTMLAGNRDGVTMGGSPSAPIPAPGVDDLALTDEG